jgi:hypothetical protein
MVPHCARCKRRNVVSYHVPEETKRVVLLGRWKTGVCPSCFNEGGCTAPPRHKRYTGIKMSISSPEGEARAR